MANLVISRLSHHSRLNRLGRSVLPCELLDFWHDELGLLYLRSTVGRLVYLEDNLTSLPKLFIRYWVTKANRLLYGYLSLPLLKIKVWILSIDAHLLNLRIQGGLGPLQVFVLRRHTNCIATSASIKQYLLLMHFHLSLPVVLRLKHLLLLLLLLLHELLFLQHSLRVLLCLIFVVVLMDLNLHVGQVLGRVAHHTVLQLLCNLVDKVVSEASLVHDHHCIVTSRTASAWLSLKRALMVMLLILSLMFFSLTVYAIVFVGAFNRNLWARRSCSCLSSWTSLFTLPVSVRFDLPLVAVFVLAHNREHKVFVTQGLYLLEVRLSKAVIAV